MNIKIYNLESFLEYLENNGCYIESVKGDKSITVDYDDTRIILIKEQPGVYKLLPKRTFLSMLIAFPFFFGVVYFGQIILQMGTIFVGLAFGATLLLFDYIHGLIKKNKLRQFCEEYSDAALKD